METSLQCCRADMLSCNELAQCSAVDCKSKERGSLACCCAQSAGWLAAAVAYLRDQAFLQFHTRPRASYCPLSPARSQSSATMSLSDPPCRKLLVQRTRPGRRWWKGAAPCSGGQQPWSCRVRSSRCGRERPFLEAFSAVAACKGQVSGEHAWCCCASARRHG